MKVIGFANKFFTLWEVTSETRENNYGSKLIITTHRFKKNISMDRETAIHKYPEAAIDESLRGYTKTFKSYKEEWTNVDTFRFGKNKGLKIADVNDLDYTRWYWGCIEGEHKLWVGEFLFKNGYEIRSIGWGEDAEEICLSPADLEKEREAEIAHNASLEKLNAGGELKVFFPYNISSEGSLVLEDGICYHFNEFKYIPATYYAPSFYLPTLGGKGKRIKNKNVIITEYTVEDVNGLITVNITNFKIEK